MTLNANGRLVSLDSPLVMGILNVTPDSFHDGGNYQSSGTIGHRIEQMVAEGVDIIDIGGMSSRPGAQPVSVEEEISRVKQALQLIKASSHEVMISIDTYRAGVVSQLIDEFEIHFINDISGGDLDTTMFDTVARSKCAYIMMHMKGTPSDMQVNPKYDDVTLEVLTNLKNKIRKARQSGIYDIIADVGFGFGKTIEHNYTLLRQLKVFKILEVPILAGLSRKSMIYKRLNILPQEALNGTTALHMAALINGAKILRVHDVREAKEVVTLYKNLMNA